MKTNWQRITEMSVDELAEYLTINCFDVCGLVCGTTESIKQWLLAEVEE